MSVICRSIQVSGIVQGVGFRYSARAYARNLGLKGFVKNLRDGTVYIEISGEEEKVTDYIRWCHTGPSHARVNHVQVAAIEGKEYRGFDVRF